MGRIDAEELPPAGAAAAGPFGGRRREFPRLGDEQDRRTRFPAAAPITYAITPKKPEMVCIQVYPFVRGLPSGVTSAMTERVGLKLMLMARSRNRATTIATASRLPTPRP